jgi:hypothetical protein
MQKIKAVAYYGGIPPNNSNIEKPLILDNFLRGVTSSGDLAVAHRGMDLIPCDVALIQGFVHEDGKTLPHLILRRQAHELQQKTGKKSLIVDSNLFLYADQGNTKRYLRYSFDGVFPTTGFYFDKDVDPLRWDTISKKLNIKLQPYRIQGNHILICLQRHGGWSMGGLSVTQWLDQTINEIRKYSRKRPIVVRCHPNDKKIKRILSINYKNVHLSTSTNIVDDLINAWATVIYNSSPGIASMINGIPVFVTDPIPQHSQSYEVANTNLSDLENPRTPDRQQWIEKIAMCHWNFEELANGEAWRFFKRYI